MNPYYHLESERTRIDEKIFFIIDNIKVFCDNGGLYPVKVRKGKYIPGNVYNQMKEIFIKNGIDKSLLGLNSSEDIPNFTNHEISESDIKCDKSIAELCNNMSKK